MQETTIIIILKPEKDQLKSESYHPIPLFTSDVKILARVLANRLSRYINTLIHKDQTGFIPFVEQPQQIFIDFFKICNYLWIMEVIVLYCAWMARSPLTW